MSSQSPHDSQSSSTGSYYPTQDVDSQDIPASASGDDADIGSHDEELSDQDQATLDARPRSPAKYQERHESSIERSSSPAAIVESSGEEGDEDDGSDAASDTSSNTEIFQPALYADLAANIPVSGFAPLIDAAIQDDILTHHPYFNNMEDAEEEKERKLKFRRECIWTVCSMDQDVLREICGGNLAKAYIEANVQGSLCKGLDRLRERSHKQPSLYRRSLADSDGNPPSARQLSKVAEVLRVYLSRTPDDWQTAFDVDTMFDDDWDLTSSKRGQRRFTDVKGKYSKLRVRQLRMFLDALERRIDAAEDQDAPLLPPLCYIGYSINSVKRQAQHDKHTSQGNYLMSLVYGICCTFLDKTDWHLHSHVICVIGDPKQVTAGEMLCTRIGGGYSSDGTGFCIAPAGISASSARKLLRLHWEPFQEWVACNTDLEQQ